MSRGQSNVVGVALLLAVTVVSMGALTAAVGVVIGENAARADALRVADGMTATVSGAERTGRHRDRIAFTSGRLGPEQRDLRVLADGEVRRRVRVGALVFASEDARVAGVGGAVVRDAGGGPRLHHPPPVTVGEEVLVVGAVRAGADDTVSGTGGVTAVVKTRVTHERHRLGTGRYAVALETATPRPLADWFRERGASVGVRALDDDGVDSVVASFDGRRTAYLVVHDLHAEVTPRG